MGRNSLEGMVDGAMLGIVITDPNQSDNPIVYVNEGFERITQYSRDYAVGRNCRFLQGEGTDPEHRRRFREALANAEEATIHLVNYRADGTRFLNQVVLSPVFDETGELTNFLGVQQEIAEEAPSERGFFADGSGRRSLRAASSDVMLKELQHRVKNHLAMVVSMIRMQADMPLTRESYLALSRRVQALAMLYDELMRPAAEGDHEQVNAGTYLARVATVIADLDGRSSIALQVDCKTFELPVDPAAQLGLLLTELLTNCFAHAFEGRESGRVRVQCGPGDGESVTLTVEDDGNGLPAGLSWPYDADTLGQQQDRAAEGAGDLDTISRAGRTGLGGSIVLGLTKALDATLDVQSGEDGTRITITLDTSCV